MANAHQMSNDGSDVTEVDVVIVGAGLAGLTTAWRLHRAGVTSMAVLEAQSRVGGRTLNYPVEVAGFVEQGGTWVGPTHHHLLALAREVGVRITPGKPEGKTFYGNGGQWEQVDSANEEGSAAQTDFEQALSVFEALSATIDTENPARSPDSDALDRTTMGAWIAANTRTAGGKALFEGCIRKMQGGDPGDVSLLWMLQFIGSATFGDLLHTAEDYRFVGGSHSVSIALAKELEAFVTLNAPVDRVSDYSGKRIDVSSGNRVWRAKRLVIATMPSCVDKIIFDPPLPHDHRQLAADWSTMSWIKFNAIYPTPFWRENTVGCQFLCLDRLVEAFDISPKTGEWGEIVGFILPDSPGRKAEEREAFCLDFLEDVYGPGAGTPLSLSIIDWNANAWTGGCVSAPRPGVLTSCPDGLTKPVGRVDWAGTERADVWVNYMEGAVRSGERAARRVLSALTLEDVVMPAA